VGKAVVILVWVGDTNTQQRRIGPVKPLDRMQSQVVWVSSVQRQPNIQDDSLPLGFDFDARAADLMRPPVDTNAHCAASALD
jgi:hypothetical protein